MVVAAVSYVYQQQLLPSNRHDTCTVLPALLSSRSSCALLYGRHQFDCCDVFVVFVPAVVVASASKPATLVKCATAAWVHGVCKALQPDSQTGWLASQLDGWAAEVHMCRLVSPVASSQADVLVNAVCSLFTDFCAVNSHSCLDRQCFLAAAGADQLAVLAGTVGVASAPTGGAYRPTPAQTWCRMDWRQVGL